MRRGYGAPAQAAELLQGKVRHMALRPQQAVPADGKATQPRTGSRRRRMYQDALPAGSEYVYRERALGSGAISEIFSSINHQIEHARLGDHSAEWVEEEAPFIGEIYMGHLRYSTTGAAA